MTPIPRPTPRPEPDPHRRRLVQGAALALFGVGAAGLSGCGGGDDDAKDTLATDRKRGLGGVDSGGTGAELFMSAAFDRLAPLTAGGVAFDTSVARIGDADGHALSDDDLAPGMTGHIRATPLGGSAGGTPNARAWEIEVGEQVLGPAGSVDLGAEGVWVLGLWAGITSRTVFGAELPQGLRSVRPGMALRVWGELDPLAGRVFATRVAEAVAPEAHVLRGVLTLLDRVAGRLRIGTWEAAFDPSDTALVGAELQVGRVVRARLGVGSASGRLLGIRADALRLPEHSQAEVHGRVTRIDTPLRFAVDGVDVDITGASEVQGLKALALGARAEVQGRVVNGLLQATQIALEAEAPVELAGVVSELHLAERSLVLRGITVTWTAATRFEGGTARLLAPNRRVAVVGRWSPGRRQLEASRIHLEA